MPRIFGFERSVKSIVNYFSGGGVAGVGVAFSSTKQTLSGAVTAATYKDILTISGGGIIWTAAVGVVDTTSRTVGLRLVLDGVTVFDAISAAITTANNGFYAVFSTTYNPRVISFRNSCVIGIKSSLSETDKIYLLCDYTTT
jgi:hypothetical protein